MYTRYTTTVRNNVCCKFILEYNQYEIYKTYEQRVVGPFNRKVLYLFIKDTVSNTLTYELTKQLNSVLKEDKRIRG